jgi:HEAT repeat protein
MMNMKNHNYGIDQLRESMVKILKDDDGKTIAGSGFIIRSDGYLITCHHVIYLLDSLKVEYQGKIYEAQWREELSDPEVDIAILKIDVRDVKAVPIVDLLQEAPTSVTVYGFPKSKETQFPEGFDVSAQSIRPSAPVNTISTYPLRETSLTNPWNKLPKPESNFPSHRIDAKVDSGTSGGPVFAEELGGVVGVIQCSKSDESYVIRWGNITETLDKLGLEPQKNAVCQFLEEIEDEFKYIKLFHSPQEIILEDQYIPIEVTLERKYRHEVETSWGYAESEEELKRIYALKRMDEESQPSQVPWEEAKKKHQRIMVLADPGMGKSTLLKMEALSTARGEREKQKNGKDINDVIFPIALTLSELNEKDEEIYDSILALISRNYPKTSGGIIHLLEKNLNDGKCLLLLDALDEVRKDDRNNLSKKLERFARNYPCPIICTSRIVGYGDAFLADAKEVEIVPFSQKQIERYVKTWFANAAGSINDDSVSADGLLQELRNKPQIRGLSQNPLLLSLLCRLYQEKKLMLPARRCQVYEKAVYYMLSEWRSKRKQQDESTVDVKIELLEELAYYFTCEGKEIFSLRELRHHFEKCMDKLEAAKFVTELTEEDGIIQKLDRDATKYIFLHRTFQEYLTASYLNNQPDCIDLAKAHFWDYDWHETLSLLAGLMKDSLPLLQAITDEKDDIFGSLLLLAGRCIVEYKETSHPVIAETINRIYELWKSHRYRDFVNSTAIALGQVHSQMLKNFQQALDDADTGIRSNAAEALAQIGNSTAVEPLVRTLDDEDEKVRWHAAKALGQIGDSKAIYPLIRVIKVDKSVRYMAANALGQIRDSTAVEELILLLRDAIDWSPSCEEDWHFRGALESAVEEIDNPKAIEPLIRALDYKEVRWHATKALGRIGDSRAIEPLFRTLDDDDQTVRSNAAEALEQIISRLNHENQHVRSDSAKALQQIDTSTSIGALIRDLDNWDNNIEWRAAKALGLTDNFRAVESLLRDLKEHGLTRGIPLQQIGSSTAVEPLIRDLDDWDDNIRWRAVTALGQISNSTAVEPLIRALKDNNDMVRWTAAKALGRIGDSITAEPVIRALNYRNKKEIKYVLAKIVTLDTLKQIIQSPQIDIYDPDIFHLARRLAVRFSKEKTPFIPVYPELIGRRKT